MVHGRVPGSAAVQPIVPPADLPELRPVWVPDPDDVEPQGLILWRSGAEVLAYENRCPHAGRRLDFAPGRFLLRNGELVCPAHGAVFRISDGACLGGPCRGESLRTRPVRRQALGSDQSER